MKNNVSLFWKRKPCKQVIEGRLPMWKAFVLPSEVGVGGGEGGSICLFLGNWQNVWEPLSLKGFRRLQGWSRGKTKQRVEGEKQKKKLWCRYEWVCFSANSYGKLENCCKTEIEIDPLLPKHLFVSWKLTNCSELFVGRPSEVAGRAGGKTKQNVDEN